MIAKFFEFSRIIIVIGGSSLFSLLVPHDPVLLLHYLMPCVVLPLSGLTGIEGLFFSKYTAKSLGREFSPYQYQSAVNNLAVGITGLMVWLANWGLYADAAMMISSLLFITFSACIHTWEAIKTGNKNLKNMMRGIWTIGLLIFFVPVLVQALF